MHIHAEPMAGAVHVEGEVGAFFDHVLEAAVFVVGEQAHIEHALGEHFDGCFVRVDEAHAGLGGGNGGFLAGQDDFVQLALRRGELAVGGEGAGDVARVAVQLAASIDQDQIAGCDFCIACAVVQYAGICAAGHDAGVGWVFAALAAEFVQELSF